MQSQADLPREDGKPPAKLCVLIGLYGLSHTSIATMFEVLTYDVQGVSWNTYVLAWDEKRGVWGTLMSISDPRFGPAQVQNADRPPDW
jgi:hypothetical protein